MSYSDMTVKDLRWIATQRKIPGRSKATRKAQLVTLIEKWQESEQSAKQKVSEAIAKTPDAWNKGQRSHPSHDLYMETIRRNYPNWQEVARDLEKPVIHLKRIGDFALGFGASAIKIAIAAECLLTTQVWRDGANLQSGFPRHALDRYKAAIEAQGIYKIAYVES